MRNQLERILLLVALFWPSAPFIQSSRRQRSSGLKNQDATDNDDFASIDRRLFLGVPVAWFISSQPALASTGLPINPFRLPSANSVYVVQSGVNASQPLQRGPLDPKLSELSSELCLLKLLPVKNPLFRELESYITGLGSMERAVAELDKRRGQLEPVFNPNDNSALQIRKAERGEQLVERLRDCLVELGRSNDTVVAQRKALLALSDVGELLVSNFPYSVPTEDKFSYLPRLLGRAKVTLTFRRDRKLLGNVTIVADGFAAPITAGNFVDLCVRQFYTGLPIKSTKRRLGTGSEFEVANLPILGSFQEGFYDPLTAKPRRIPLEIVRVGKGSSVPILTYAQGLSKVPGSLEPMDNRQPLLSFSLPGLIAMNHPDKNPNGGSSEFFGLQDSSVMEEKRNLLDGEYAPFGFITDGYELFQKLRPNDIIDATYVNEWGQLNLVKIRQSSFSEVFQSGEE